MPDSLSMFFDNNSSDAEENFEITNNNDLKSEDFEENSPLLSNCDNCENSAKMIPEHCHSDFPEKDRNVAQAKKKLITGHVTNLKLCL